MKDYYEILARVDDQLVGLNQLEADNIVRAIYVSNLCAMDRESRRESIKYLLRFINIINDTIFEDQDDVIDFLEKHKWRIMAGDIEDG